jgi:hypothetical protein
MTQLHRLCGRTWSASWPCSDTHRHRCAIRAGAHIQHACHCGTTQRVTDTEAQQLMHGEPLEEGP